MYLVLLGAPGSGKGTQAQALSQKLGVAHLASGDLFRQAAEKGTSLGLLAKSYMEKGALVPDEVTIQMVLERLSSDDSVLGCVFDGFPRTWTQARARDEGLSGQHKAIDKAIYRKVSNEELLKRLSGRWLCRNCQAPYHVTASPPKTPGRCDRCGGELYQRSDDTEETIKERLKVYFDQTTPLFDYYKGGEKLVEVNGELAMREVTEEIIKTLEIGIKKGS